MNAYTRIQWLHEQIKAFRYPNAQRLAERFGVSHRQAQRDIHQLREELKAPLIYSPERRGFAYSTEFSLPLYYRNENDSDYSEFLDRLIAAQEEQDEAAQRYVQLQIPFTATLHIPEKLTRMSLDRFIVADQGNDCFLCEFSHVDLFLSAILLIEANVTILSPAWLRDRLLSIAERILQNHKEVSDAE
ncbi:MAG: HTH domain-containing protein [Clostridia bacterium]|nr:HTH domain-containing protein [Clostridia bacterium]